jgi:hypothetical protein
MARMGAGVGCLTKPATRRKLDEAVIVEKLDLIGTEPVTFRLFRAKTTKFDIHKIEQFLQDWLARRDARPVCRFACRSKFLTLRMVSKGNVEIAIQWVCAECLNLLCAQMGEQFGNLERARILVVPPPKIRFEGRSVTFADGRVEKVGPFEVVNRAVSVEEMAAFCDATGYVTSGELQGSDDNFRMNDYLKLWPPSLQPICSAHFLSHRDAAAYCDWAGYRLPKDGEYFVGAYVDDEVHDSHPQQSVTMNAIGTGAVFLFGDYVITDTKVGDLYVARHGTRMVKRPAWYDERPWLVSDDQPAGTIVRVVRSDGPA